MDATNIPNNTTYGSSLHYLIGEFMNLVNACEYKGVEFEAVDGFNLQDCRDVISDYLTQLGYSDEIIEKLWSGENQF
jgi:hypothetical protein